MNTAETDRGLAKSLDNQSGLCRTGRSALAGYIAELIILTPAIMIGR
jgi:hypothetical protein